LEEEVANCVGNEHGMWPIRMTERGEGINYVLSHYKFLEFEVRQPGRLKVLLYPCVVKNLTKGGNQLSPSAFAVL
jgi:hypothetical protein